MLGLVLLLSAVALVALRNVNEDLDRAAKVTARKQYLAGGVNAAASEMASLERASVLAAVVGDEAIRTDTRSSFGAAEERLQSAIAELRRLSDTKRSRFSVAADGGAGRTGAQAQEELRQALANQQLDTALSIFSQKLQPRLEGIGARGVVAGRSAERELTAASAGIRHRSRRGRGT